MVSRMVPTSSERTNVSRRMLISRTVRCQLTEGKDFRKSALTCEGGSHQWSSASRAPHGAFFDFGFESAVSETNSAENTSISIYSSSFPFSLFCHDVGSFRLSMKRRCKLLCFVTEQTYDDAEYRIRHLQSSPHTLIFPQSELANPRSHELSWKSGLGL